MLSERLQSIVDLLKFEFGNYELTSLIESELGDVPKSADVFAVKYQIQRLAKPCKRAMDFRFRAGNVAVNVYEDDEFTHFIDEHSHQVFKKIKQKYQGRYTEGVYLAVEDYFLTNKHLINELQKFHPKPLMRLQFQSLQTREHARLFLSKSISLFVIPQGISESQVLAVLADQSLGFDMKTSDISVDGLRVHGDLELSTNQRVGIRFSGFESDYVIERPHLLYRVVSRQSIENKQWRYALNIDGRFENIEMQNLIQRVVSNNTKRHTVDVENVEQALVMRGFAQCKLGTSEDICLAIGQSNAIQHVLMSHRGKQLVEGFFPDDWLTVIHEKDNLIENSQNHPLLYFAVNCNDSKVAPEGLYSCVLDGSYNNMRMFRHFASHQLGQVFSIQFIANDQWSNFNLDGLKRSNESKEPLKSQLNMSRELVDRLKGMVIFSPLPLIVGHFVDKVSNKRTRAPGKSLGEYQGVVNAAHHQYEKWMLVDSHDKRKEPRYPINGSLNIKLAGHALSADLVDVSASGLMCLLRSPAPIAIDKGIEVLVHFVELATKVSKFDLRRCQYQLVNCEDNILRLRVIDGKNSETMRFWSAYLRMRQSKLGQRGVPKQPMGLKKILSTVVASCRQELLVTYSILSNRPVFSRIVIPFQTPESMGQTVAEQVEALLKAEPIFEYFKEHPVAQCEILALVKFSSNNEVRSCQLCNREDYQDHANAMLAELQKNSSAKLLLLRGETPTAIDFSSMQAEAKYIKRFAPHKYNEISTELNGLKGLLSVFDLTTLVINADDYYL